MGSLVEEIKEMFSIDEKLQKYLQACETVLKDKILHRCHIEEVPEGLNSIIKQFLIEQYLLNKEGIGEGKVEVSDVSDNGQKVSFKQVGGVSNMSRDAEEFINRNKKDIYAFRKMRW